MKKYINVKKKSNKNILKTEKIEHLKGVKYSSEIEKKVK